MKPTFVLALCALAGCEQITETPEEQPVGAALTGASVKPTAISTTGSGTFSGNLRTLGSEAVLDYSIEFTGLSDVSSSAHLHGPAGADNVGGILLDFSALPAGSSGTIQLGAESGTGAGTIDLKRAVSATVSGDSLHKLISAGLAYVDVHTATNVNGEIRGQLTRH